MPLKNSRRAYQLKAVTDLWTGSADRKSDSLKNTGLLGSIRWWFEVLVRGLGSCACDPTHEKSEYRCPSTNKNPTDSKHHCVVCELFGCTDWARKFRFEVLGENLQIQKDQIKDGDSFIFRFIELRPIRPQEWALLDATMRLIAEYGAIGGKTVLKPSDESNRANKSHHQDYGLLKLVDLPKEDSAGIDLRKYVSEAQWWKVNHGAFTWASLKNFWCVNGKYLARQDDNTSAFNRVIGRPESKIKANYSKDWLAGRQQISKKVFSFKKHPRTFGFVNPGMIDFSQIKEKLHSAWSDFNDEDFIGGFAILEALFTKENLS